MDALAEKVYVERLHWANRIVTGEVVSPCV